MIISLSFLHGPDHPKKFTAISREERGREEIQVIWRGKRRVKGEKAVKPVITLLSKSVY